VKQTKQKLNQPQSPLFRSAKIHPKYAFQFHPPSLFIISEHLAFTNHFSAQPLKDNIPDHIKIITGLLTIIPEQSEWFPTWVSPVMGFSAGICRVTVIVTDVFNLPEICLQDFDISINERAVVFFLSEIESRVIGCSHFGWSFHDGCPFWCLFSEIRAGEMLEIYFAFQNGKMFSLGSGDLEWRMGTDADLNWLVQFVN